MSGTTTRSASMFVLHHWRDNIYGLDGKMRDWFDAQGFSRIQDFAILTDEDIEEMEYVDATGVASKPPKVIALVSKRVLPTIIMLISVSLAPL
jgi:hypothetical protein